MNLLQQFKEFIGKESLFLPAEKLLLAVSGGLDSVVLSDLCYKAGFDFTIAHCNFQLRGEESMRDEQFVQQLGARYSKEVLVKHFDTKTFASQNKVSIQVAARELRYAWFYELLGKDKSLHYLITAHHLDDNIETMLMNLFKGTGIAGLRGILPKQDKLLRPLLFANKEIIHQYAMADQLSWAEDSSNSTDDYSRNYFRHQVIPLIEKLYPGAVNNLGENLSRFRDIELLYQQSIAFNKKKLLVTKGNEIHMPILKLKRTGALPSVLYEIAKAYGFSSAQVEEIISLLDSETGKYIESATHRIIKNRQWLIIAPQNNSESNTILIEQLDTKIVYPGGILSVSSPGNKNETTVPSKDTNTACIDAAAVHFPMFLRKWKEGDYFYPLGMQKKKKLARFIIDQKLSRTEKESIWVIESARKIIWVIGHRIDDRFKLKPSTQQQLRITVSKTV